MDLQQSIAELRVLQHGLDPERSERDADLYEAIETVLSELHRLRGNEFVSK